MNLILKAALFALLISICESQSQNQRKFGPSFSQHLPSQNEDDSNELVTPRPLTRPIFNKERSGRAESSRLIATIKKGSLRGKQLRTPKNEQVYGFFGVPYAKPPLGDLRFKKPIPNEKWSGVYDATKLSDTCFQFASDFFPGFRGEEMWNPVTNVSEDCLYLNIWVPEKVFEAKDTELVSVIFWIHGGGLFSGSSNLDVYDGLILAGEQQVIVVSIQYRLGPAGFLYFGTEDAPGNVGLFDQNLALQWTRENIEYFGGDPNSITLFGESAGSSSVHYHLLSYHSRHLFKRGILQSGSAMKPYSFTPKEKALRIAQKLAKDVGCDGDDTSEVIRCLRNTDIIKLTAASWKSYEDILEFPMIATLDGDFLEEEPEKMMEKNDAKRAEIIVGTVLDEGSYFVLYQYLKYFDHLEDKTINHDQFLNIMNEIFKSQSNEEREAIIHYYTNWENVEDGNKNRENVVHAVGDYFFVCPLRDLADKWSNRGLKTYFYHFTARSSSNPWAKWMGVMHGDDIEFSFGVPLRTLGYTNEERDLSQNMMTLFANFAKIGTPSSKWERYTQETPVYLNLNSTKVSDASSHGIHGPRADACAFWNIVIANMKNDESDEEPKERKHKNNKKASKKGHRKNHSKSSDSHGDENERTCSARNQCGCSGKNFHDD